MKTSTSSVFAPYTKEESPQRMQLKHIHQQQSKQQASQQSEKPIAVSASPTTPSASASATAAEATNSCTTTPVHIPYNIDWIFKRLKNPNTFWYFCSQIAIFTVGLFSKIVLGKSRSVCYSNLLFISIHFTSFFFLNIHTHIHTHCIYTHMHTYIICILNESFFCFTFTSFCDISVLFVSFFILFFFLLSIPCISSFNIFIILHIQLILCISFKMKLIKIYYVWIGRLFSECYLGFLFGLLN